MDHIYQNLKQILEEIEDLIDEDDESFEHSEKIENLISSFEKEYKEVEDITDGMDDESDELKQLKNRYLGLDIDFDRPQDIIDATMNDMFPDEESYEGFDYDDHFEAE